MKTSKLLTAAILAFYGVNQATEMYEPTYNKIKTEKNVIVYKVQGFPLLKRMKDDGYKMTGVVSRPESLLVKYDPYRGLVSFKGYVIKGDSVLFSLNASGSYSRRLGRSKLEYKVGHDYTNQRFLGSEEYAKYVEQLSIDAFDKRGNKYVLSEQLRCKDKWVRRPKSQKLIARFPVKIVEADGSFDFTCDYNLDSLQAWVSDGRMFQGVHYDSTEALFGNAIPVYEKVRDCRDRERWFGLDAKGNECIEWKTCNDEEFFDSTSNVCFPENSRVLGESWVCNDGFVAHDEKCAKVIRDCGISAVFESDKRISCVNIPRGARKTGDYTWDCYDGFIKANYGCMKIPENATKISPVAWRCNDGYTEYEPGVCRKTVVCSEKQIFGDNMGSYCVDIPDGAEKSSDYFWKCRDDYYQVSGEDKCIKKPSPLYGNLLITLPFLYGSREITGAGGSDDLTYDLFLVSLAFGFELGFASRDSSHTAFNQPGDYSIGLQGNIGVDFNNRTYQEIAKTNRYSYGSENDTAYGLALYLETAISVNLSGIELFPYWRWELASSGYLAYPNQVFKKTGENFGLLVGFNYDQMLVILLGYGQRVTIDNITMHMFEIRSYFKW